VALSTTKGPRNLILLPILLSITITKITLGWVIHKEKRLIYLTVEEAGKFKSMVPESAQLL
jgi:hypothetical protein